MAKNEVALNGISIGEKHIKISLKTYPWTQVISGICDTVCHSSIIPGLSDTKFCESPNFRLMS